MGVKNSFEGALSILWTYFFMHKRNARFLNPFFLNFNQLPAAKKRFQKTSIPTNVRPFLFHEGFNTYTHLLALIFRIIFFFALCAYMCKKRQLNQNSFMIQFCLKGPLIQIQKCKKRLSCCSAEILPIYSSVPNRLVG